MKHIFNLGLFPIVFAIVTITGYIVPYIISTSLGHTYPWLPSISDSGVHSPESLVFRELMNLSGFLGMMNCLIRFMQYRLIITALDEELIPEYVTRFNVIALLLGLFGGFSVTFVGNFQTKLHRASVVENAVHDVAAVVAFSTGILYSVIQTVLSYRMNRYGLNTKKMAHFRLLLTLGIVISFFSFLLCGIVSNEEFNRVHDPSDNERKLQWRPQDPGYAFHVIANISEWIMCLIFVVYSLTFVREFSMIRITSSFSEPHSIEQLLSNENIETPDEDSFT